MKKLTSLLGMTLLFWCIENARAQELDDIERYALLYIANARTEERVGVLLYIARVSELAGLCQALTPTKPHVGSISDKIAFVASSLKTQTQAASISEPDPAKICEHNKHIFELIVGD